MIPDEEKQGGYYDTWKAQIAKAFYDELSEWVKHTGGSSIHVSVFNEIANDAAKRLLDTILHDIKTKDQ